VELEWEPELVSALELAQGALVEVLKLALNGELQQGWHRKCSKLNTLAGKAVAKKFPSNWYVDCLVVLQLCLSHPTKGEVVD
jgi:hypothetical protein